MTYVSDQDTNGDGKFGVEWEFECGGRWWQWFDTKEQRAEAIKENEELNKLEEEYDG